MTVGIQRHATRGEVCPAALLGLSPGLLWNDAQASAATPVTGSAEERSVPRRQHCPLCKESLAVGAELVECAECLTIYHSDCAEELGGCGTLGCHGRITRGTPERPIVWAEEGEEQARRQDQADFREHLGSVALAGSVLASFGLAYLRLTAQLSNPGFELFLWIVTVALPGTFAVWQLWGRRYFP